MDLMGQGRVVGLGLTEGLRFGLRGGWDLGFGLELDGERIEFCLDWNDWLGWAMNIMEE